MRKLIATLLLAAFTLAVVVPSGPSFASGGSDDGAGHNAGDNNGGGGHGSDDGAGHK
jgi:hypothetical protein